MKSDRIFGVIGVCVSAAMGVTASRLTAPIAYEPVGPGAYPELLAWLMTACSLWLVIHPDAGHAWPEAGLWRRIGLMSGMLLAYAFLFQPLGFALSTALLTVGLGRLLGARWRQCIVGGALMGPGLYVAFDKLLEVSLPVGGLWNPL